MCTRIAVMLLQHVFHKNPYLRSLEHVLVHCIALRCLALHRLPLHNKKHCISAWRMQTTISLGAMSGSPEGNRHETSVLRGLAPSGELRSSPPVAEQPILTRQPFQSSQHSAHRTREQDAPPKPFRTGRLPP